MLPEDKHIESEWKTAFDEAAISPSKNLWEGLESILTEQQETTSWQNAFADAATTPTPELWTKIENELNHKKHRPFLFWLNSNTIKIAAGVLLILGVYQLSVDNEGKRARRQEVKSNQQVVVKSDEVNADQPKAKSEQGIEATRQQVTISQQAKGTKAQSSKGTGDESFVINQQEPIVNSLSEIRNPKPEMVIYPQQVENLIPHTSYLIPTAQLATVQPQILYLIPHNSYIVSQPSKKESRQIWLGFSSGTSSFNPDLNLTGVQGVAAGAFSDTKIFESDVTAGMLTSINSAKTNNFASANTPQNENKSGVSLQFGVWAGTKLGKKISFETGLQVLKGNSTFSTNTFLIDRQTSQKTNLYALGISEKLSTDVVNQSVGLVSELETVQNNYVFLQVPFRVGYQLFQKEKIGLTALGGLSADVFLTNSFGDAILRNTNQNTYKTLNTSALLGLRANYKLYDHWYWNTTLNHQQSLFPNNKSTALIGIKLKMTGLSMGLQYKF